MKFDDVFRAFQEEKEKVMANKKSMLDECNLMLAICQKHLKKLRQAVLEKGFQRKKQEIRFFKHVKPTVLSDFFFYWKVRPVEMTFLNNQGESNKERLLGQIEEIKTALLRNNDFLHYVAGGYTRLDKEYFTLQKNVYIPEDNLFYYLDPEHSTSHGGLLATLTAYRRLSQHLDQRLNSVGEKGKNAIFTSGKMQWTSSKADLVELIYALHLNGSIGHGKSQLKELTHIFQSLFDIEVPEPYKIFSEVKNRQKSQTKFLNELTVNLQKHIDENC